MPPPPRFVRPLLAKIAPGLIRRPLQGAPRPRELLELYGTEACPACRRVRRALTELDLDFIHRSCPVGDSPKRAALLERGGQLRMPYLIDPNTGRQMYESRDIVRYLVQTYGGQAETSPANA